ncbi:hypothetical protein CJ204_12530 [Corynebacterium xerosis]|uniref:Uncharacterized protein n=1 Tax=Corynebacterium xerosis TaxID=1725 RepID=A0A2N6SVS0_9CORY|nr:hypothetical protein CJ204_12530 [Corynebacterium xerosis]
MLEFDEVAFDDLLCQSLGVRIFDALMHFMLLEIIALGASYKVEDHAIHLYTWYTQQHQEVNRPGSGGGSESTGG